MSLWLLGVVSLAFGGASVASLLYQAGALAILFHVLGAAAGTLSTMTLRRDGVSAAPVFEYVAAFCVPCVGGALVWAHAAGARISRPGVVAEDFARYIDAEVRMGEEKLPEVRPGLIPTPGQLAPMADVLLSNANDDEKRIAIETLVRLETPEAVDVLRQALTNLSTEVRFYAAGALSKLEERLTLRQKTLQEALARLSSPSAASGRGEVGAALHLEMARSYLDYAYYHVLDTDLRVQYLEKALVHARYAAQQGDEPAAWITAGRILLKLGRFAGAEDCFSRYLERVPDDVKAWLWRAEARFRLGRYGDVSKDCARAKKLGGVPERIADAVDMWA